MTEEQFNKLIVAIEANTKAINLMNVTMCALFDKLNIDEESSDNTESYLFGN